MNSTKEPINIFDFDKEFNKWNNGRETYFAGVITWLIHTKIGRDVIEILHNKINDKDFYK